MRNEFWTQLVTNFSFCSEESEHSAQSLDPNVSAIAQSPTVLINDLVK
jgi:hypothetical protein